MSDKDFSMAIYNELLKLAKGYFFEISTNWGVGAYDLNDVIKKLCSDPEACGLHAEERKRKEMASAKDYQKQSLIRSCEHEYYPESELVVEAWNSGRIMNISIDSFNLTFDACKVFEYTQKFERMAKIKEKAMFIKKGEIMDDFIGSFSILIEKKHLGVCKTVSDEDLRPAMRNVYIDTKNKAMVSTDGYTLQEFEVQVWDVKGDTDLFSPFIDPGTLRKCLGVCQVKVYETKSGKYYTLITNERGERFKTNHPESNFVDYREAYPNVGNEGYVRIKESDIKQLLKIVKAISRLDKYSLFTLSIEAFKQKVNFIHEDAYRDISRNSSFELERVPNFSMEITFDSKRFLGVSEGWDGGMWLTGPSRAVVLDTDSLVSLIMPRAKGNDTRSIQDQIEFENPVPAIGRRSLDDTESIELLTITPESIAHASTHAFAECPDNALGSSESKCLESDGILPVTLKLIVSEISSLSTTKRNIRHIPGMRHGTSHIAGLSSLDRIFAFDSS